MRNYKVTVNGTETVMQLSDEDAKAYGDNATAVGDDDAAADPDRKSVANKARTAGQ